MALGERRSFSARDRRFLRRRPTTMTPAKRRPGRTHYGGQRCRWFHAAKKEKMRGMSGVTLGPLFLSNNLCPIFSDFPVLFLHNLCFFQIFLGLFFPGV